MRELLEQATGRKLIGFVGKQRDRDIICEFFVLAPNDVTG